MQLYNQNYAHLSPFVTTYQDARNLIATPGAPQIPQQQNVYRYQHILPGTPQQHIIQNQQHPLYTNSQHQQPINNIPNPIYTQHLQQPNTYIQQTPNASNTAALNTISNPIYTQHLQQPTYTQQTPNASTTSDAVLNNIVHSINNVNNRLNGMEKDAKRNIDEQHQQMISSQQQELMMKLKALETKCTEFDEVYQQHQQQQVMAQLKESKIDDVNNAKNANTDKKEHKAKGSGQKHHILWAIISAQSCSRREIESYIKCNETEIKKALKYWNKKGFVIEYVKGKGIYRLSSEIKRENINVNNKYIKRILQQYGSFGYKDTKRKKKKKKKRRKIKNEDEDEDEDEDEWLPPTKKPKISIEELQNEIQELRNHNMEMQNRLNITATVPATKTSSTTPTAATTTTNEGTSTGIIPQSATTTTTVTQSASTVTSPSVTSPSVNPTQNASVIPATTAIIAAHVPETTNTAQQTPSIRRKPLPLPQIPQIPPIPPKPPLPLPQIPRIPIPPKPPLPLPTKPSPTFHLNRK